MSRAVLRNDAGDLPVVRPELLRSDPDAIVSARERAEKDAHIAGYERGLAEARADTTLAEEWARADRASVLQALSHALAQVDESLEVERRRLERAAAELAFKVVESLLSRELELAASPGLDAVARAIAVAPESEGAVIRLNPADAAVLHEDDLPGNVSIVEDEKLGRGSCLLSLGAVLVDAQIETALERIRGVLEEATQR